MDFEVQERKRRLLMLQICYQVGNGMLGCDRERGLWIRGTYLEKRKFSTLQICY